MPNALLPAIVVMGVSASGKTSVATDFAGMLGLPVVDADDLHPPANVAKMASGTPLDDSDRAPWLDAVARALVALECPVVACSALKRAYRDRLRMAAPDCVFVHLTGSPELLAARAEGRTEHFMPPTLLQSQLDTLEPLQPDEAGLEVDAAAPVAESARRARRWIELYGSSNR